MENTSKALLIAAAVLIAILLITLGIRIFSSTSNSQKAAEDTGKSISEETGLAISVITGESVSNQTGTQYGPIQEIGESNNGYIPKGREGQEVTYKNNRYTILYDNGNTVQMVADRVMGGATLSLGGNYMDTVNSYNSAIEQLNELCKNLYVNDSNIVDVRSVGSNPYNKNSENKALYTDSNLTNWSCTYKGNPVVVDKIGKSGDANYEQDIERMNYWNIIKFQGGYSSPYYLASRVVDADSNKVIYRLRTIDSTGNISYASFWSVNSNGNVIAYNNAMTIRPIVTIKASAIF